MGKESRSPQMVKESENEACDTVLLARPLKAASPDAKHPRKAGKIPEGKTSFPLRDFPGFLWARSLKLS